MGVLLFNINGTAICCLDALGISLDKVCKLPHSCFNGTVHLDQGIVTLSETMSWLLSLSKVVCIPRRILSQSCCFLLLVGATSSPTRNKQLGHLGPTASEPCLLHDLQQSVSVAQGVSRLFNLTSQLRVDEGREL